jgi:hypothetical protein
MIEQITTLLVFLQSTRYVTGILLHTIFADMTANGEMGGTELLVIFVNDTIAPSDWHVINHPRVLVTFHNAIF